MFFFFFKYSTALIDHEPMSQKNEMGQQVKVPVFLHILPQYQQIVHKSLTKTGF